MTLIWIFKVKYGICYILAKNGPIARKWKASISIELKASNMTIGFDLGHDLDLEFSRSNMEFPISQPKMVWLPWNEKQTYQLNFSLRCDHQVWPWPCTGQLGGPFMKTFGRVQKSPFGPHDNSTMITEQHTTGGSVSQLSQLTQLSPWLTLSTKDITTSFWHYNKWFFLSNQIIVIYNLSRPTEWNLCIYDEK